MTILHLFSIKKTSLAKHYKLNQHDCIVVSTYETM